MNYIISAVIGIIAWQIICTIVYLISKENDKVLVWTALLVPVTFISFFGWIYRKIRLVWCKKNLNGYILYSNGVGMFQAYMTDKEAEKLYHEGESDFYIKKFSEGRTWKSAPYKGQIYKGQEEFHGLGMKKFVKEE